ncbi:MAG: HlyD family efflux transporter periplasmic adaptor subunit [Sediminibacterium sp.]|jgi:membrane fusion protein, peptide pheromone/bacteriocin exporter|uniref:HlyD family efflux transporter periplasmic adaptor subunit n=1 Tax=Sediminibacterium sp. TaxID=1917865 RepID=UPI002AB8CE80|nr:HlyD family efflux transporter periplasmic adaptor subunit [Sediminibacterium sp.]MDZ4072123.1 HlyD family efflux transporter periplasmic adaptor subunit [Sediminibacterium sp.]
MDKEKERLLEANRSIQFYLAGFSAHARLFYISLILIILIGLAMLPFCYVNVITRTEGIIRPFQERTVVRSLISATIQSVHCKDGSVVKKGDTLILFQQLNYRAQKEYIAQKINNCKKLINDLLVLTQLDVWKDTTIPNRLQTAVYRSQFLHFYDQLQEKDILSKKLQKDILLYDPLLREKVIAPNEFSDIRFQLLQASAVFQLQISKQISQWQHELIEQQKLLVEYKTENSHLLSNAQSYIVKAPITGTVLMQEPLYVGTAVIPSGELLSISPAQDLIVECWISPSNRVTIYHGQSITYSIPEIRNQMSTPLQGKIIFIAEDYTLVNNKPMFRVKCSLNQTRVQLQNGFSYALGRGLLLETRFLLARKSCWQLLYQQLYDWFNPATLSQSAA